MKFPRSSGILLHITSLPGQHGIGDLGPCAYEFADFLAAAGQSLWQVLPLHPTGYADSPYQCFSAFAGNPLLLSLELLREDGILHDRDFGDVPRFPPEQVDYGAVIDFKSRVLLRAAEAFFADASHQHNSEFEQFCRRAAPWLDDYALFMAAKEVAHGAVWTSWDQPLRRREPVAIERWSAKLASTVRAFKYWQFEFFRQWQRLRDYCRKLRIRFMGDMPIYVAHDSAD